MNMHENKYSSSRLTGSSLLGRARIRGEVGLTLGSAAHTGPAVLAHANSELTSSWCKV